MKPKKKRYLLAVGIVTVLLTVTGCASHESASAQSPEAAYEEYLALIKRDTSLRQLADYWDQQAKEMFLRTSDSSGDHIPIVTFESSLRYPKLFAEAPASPQAIEVEADSGCLLLVGPAADGGVLALSILLKKQGDLWQHSELFARYLEQAAPEPERPSCKAPEPFQD